MDKKRKGTPPPADPDGEDPGREAAGTGETAGGDAVPTESGAPEREAQIGRAVV